MLTENESSQLHEMENTISTTLLSLDSAQGVTSELDPLRGYNHQKIVLRRNFL